MHAYQGFIGNIQSNEQREMLSVTNCCQLRVSTHPVAVSHESTHVLLSTVVNMANREITYLSPTRRQTPNMQTFSSAVTSSAVAVQDTNPLSSLQNPSRRNCPKIRYTLVL